MAEQFCLRWNNHQSTLVSVFEKLLENEALIDCTLWAEGQVLRAHKVVLSACSPAFESMLCVQEDKHPIIFLKDVKYLELKAMLDYMYKGEVNISQDQLDSFLKTAEALQVKGLTDQGGGGGDEPPAKKGPGRKVVVTDAPESPLVGNAPLREGSISPLGGKRRRRVARRHSAEESESNDCDMQAPAAPPQAVPAESAARLAPPTPTPQPPPIIKKEVVPQELITPKTEYTEEQPEEIEDLTLDDDDDYGEMSKPGTSFGLSQGSTSQDFSQWQQMNDDRTRDEVFMAAQEAINNQSNAQVFQGLRSRDKNNTKGDYSLVTL
nr:longitudinals lacking protein, isoforms H/M/V [Halyomorpha halys]